MAQFGRASGWGPEGREFKSPQPDHESNLSGRARTFLTRSRAVKQVTRFTRSHFGAAVVAPLAAAGGLTFLVARFHGHTTVATTEVVRRGGREFLVQHPGTGTHAWVLVVLGVVAGLIVFALLFGNDWWTHSQFARPENRQRKIETLSTSLKDALITIELIRGEVDEGAALLARLETDVEVKRQLAALKSEEAAAVIAELRETVQRESRRGFRQQLVMNALFFIAGVGVTLLVSLR